MAISSREKGGNNEIQINCMKANEKGKCSGGYPVIMTLVKHSQHQLAGKGT